MTEKSETQEVEDFTADGDAIDDHARARRILVKTAIYVAPALIGTLAISGDAHAQAGGASCDPLNCPPGTGRGRAVCNPQSCAPGNCGPATCAPARCGPAQCQPAQCNPNKIR